MYLSIPRTRLTSLQYPSGGRSIRCLLNKNIKKEPFCPSDEMISPLTKRKTPQTSPPQKNPKTKPKTLHNKMSQSNLTQLMFFPKEWKQLFMIEFLGCVIFFFLTHQILSLFLRMEKCLGFAYLPNCVLKAIGSPFLCPHVEFGMLKIYKDGLNVKVKHAWRCRQIPSP